MTKISPALRKALENADAFAMANRIRALSIDGVEVAKSGHSGKGRIKSSSYVDKPL